jgi:probable biosynthetic protein (TIGR04098 family)
MWADARGRRLYASFVAVEVAGALLSTAVEGDEVHIESRLERIGTSVYVSWHLLKVAGRADVACIEMVTVFVRRLHATENTFERAADGPTVAKGPSPTRRPLALLDDHRALRRLQQGSPVLAKDTYLLRAHEDFNAAGMVYFANYPRFVNRLLLSSNAAGVGRGLRRRRCFFYGNLNHGDDVCAESLSIDGPAATTRLRRLPDGYPVALFETEWT